MYCLRTNCDVCSVWHSNGLRVCQKEVGNLYRYLNPNYAQTLIPMESVPALIPLIRILGDETRKDWMPREEEIKAAKLLTFDTWSNIHRVNSPHGGVRLKESSLSLTSQTILRKTLRTSNPITQ